MRRGATVGLFCLALAVSLACTGAVLGQERAITLSPPMGSVAGTAEELEISILLSSPEDVEAFAAAIEVGPLLEIVSLDQAGALASVNGGSGPDLWVPNIRNDLGGLTLGVVVDVPLPGFEGGDVAIPAGEDTLVATFRVKAKTPECPADVTISLVDGAPFEEPPLDNMVSVGGGTSYGVNEGLDISSEVDVSIECPPPHRVEVLDTVVQCRELPVRCPEQPCTNTIAEVPVVLHNSQPAQAFVIAVAHDPAVLELVEIRPGADLPLPIEGDGGTEYYVPEVGPDGGFLGVVFDTIAPYDNQQLPAGDNEVAVFVYRHLGSLPEADPPVEVSTDITPVNGVLGVPPLDNIVIVQYPDTTASEPASPDGGTLTLVGPPPCTEVICDEFELLCEPQTEWTAPDDSVTVCFSYRSTEKLMGLSMSIAFDCGDLEATDSEFVSIVDALDAEFEIVSLDNDPAAVDGDGCEIVVGLLIDSSPPFDARRLPATTVADPEDPDGCPAPQEVVCVDFLVKADATCEDCDGESDNCYVSPIRFINFLDAMIGIPTENLLVMVTERQDSIDSFEVEDGLVLTPCGVKIRPYPRFVRGDCNGDYKVDIADASHILYYVYLHVGYTDCEDACDVTDDEVLDLTDPVYLLSFLFRRGPKPPEPFNGSMPDILRGIPLWDPEARGVGQLQRGPDETETGKNYGTPPLDCERDSQCP